MTTTEIKHTSLAVAGYTTQTTDNLALVNANKRLEEVVLREIDNLATIEAVDKRMLELSRMYIEFGFMAMNRSIFRPERVALP